MKKFFIALSVLSMIACGNKGEKKNATEQKPTEVAVEKATAKEYASFGEKIAPEGAISSEEMYEKYQNLEVGDTLNVKFTSEVAAVCKKKGCWMKLNLDEGEQTRVGFKDYAFFVPKDIENKNVIVQGKAYITEVSVEDLKHFAKDEGKSEAEIAAITEPQQKLAFTATGVLIED